MNEIIKQKVDQIAECIFEKIQKNEKPESYGLYSGEFGMLLFLFYYARYSKSEKYSTIAEAYAERLFNRFLNESRLHTFCDGFSGILYLFEFLREHNFINMDVSDSQSAIDNYLIAQMRSNIQQSYYDFMHGALGVGLYFLKKGTNSECIQEIVDFLYQTAEKESDNQIFKWRSVIDHENNRIGYNLSLSHGISSIIIFLSRVAKSGVNDKKVMEMLSGAVKYILSQQRDFNQFGSYFLNYIPIDFQEYVPPKSRMAWCYGDLGIGIAIWQAGKDIDNTVWKAKGVEILIQSTKRRTFTESLINDAGICHGSAGLAMIYHRMYLETSRREFKDATDFWVKQTLNFSRFNDGLAGYKTALKDELINDNSLLTGISGIGLVLSSFLSEDKQAWDEMFLLS